MQPSSPFATPRVRLERAQDGEFFWGWLPFFGGDSARLRLATPMEVQDGEHFTIHVQGGARITTFLGEVSGQEEGEILLRVLGEVRCTTPALPPRVTVMSLVGLVHVLGEVSVGEIIDASERGAGLLLPRAVEPGVRVVIEVASEHGPVEVAGEARYCRPLDAPQGRYRVGIQIEPPSPWIASQWARLIEGDGRNDRRAA